MVVHVGCLETTHASIDQSAISNQIKSYQTIHTRSDIKVAQVSILVQGT